MKEFIYQHFHLFILLSMLGAGSFFAFLVFSGRKNSVAKEKDIRLDDEVGAGIGSILKQFLTNKQNPQSVKVLEVFDYKGIKIIHQNGKYLVDDGYKQEFLGWEALPDKYKRMVKELENRSKSKSTEEGSYFVQVQNGKYYISTPDGKRKGYSSFQSIPNHLKKILNPRDSI